MKARAHEWGRQWRHICSARMGPKMRFIWDQNGYFKIKILRIILLSYTHAPSGAPCSASSPSPGCYWPAVLPALCSHTQFVTSISLDPLSPAWRAHKGVKLSPSPQPITPMEWAEKKLDRSSPFPAQLIPLRQWLRRLISVPLSHWLHLCAAASWWPRSAAGR